MYHSLLEAQILEWLEERSFQPRPVCGNGAKWPQWVREYPRRANQHGQPSRV